MLAEMQKREKNRTHASTMDEKYQNITKVHILFVVEENSDSGNIRRYIYTIDGDLLSDAS